LSNIDTQSFSKIVDIFCRNEESIDRLKSYYLNAVFTKGLDGVNKGKISSVFKTAAGGTPSRFKRDYWGGDIPWLASGELKDRIIFESKEKITQKGLNNSSTKLFPKNTAVIAITGATTGETGLLGRDFCTNQSVVGLYPNNDFYPKFVWYFLMSKYYYFRGLTLGSAQPHINKGIIDDCDFPLVDTDLQEKIIHQVEDFVGSLQAYKQLLDSERKSREALLDCCINYLISQELPNSFDSWNYLYDNFDRLIVQSSDIGKIRQLILYLATSGKLVRQDSSAESASESMEKIAIEKKKLSMKNKIKQEKDLTPIVEKESPYPLPDGWLWVKTGDLLASFDYGTSEKSFEDIEGVPIVSMGNVVNGKLHLSNLKRVRHNSQDLPKLLLKNGDILFNRTNSLELVGKAGIYEGPADNQITFASYLIRIRILAYTNPKYLNYYFMTRTFRKTQIEPEVIKQCGQANFNGTKLKKTLVPLPPLEEQNRIVEKVGRLMQFCDLFERLMVEKRENEKDLIDAIIKDTSIFL
jgi:type I restriction enzyme, S subunit